MQREVIDNQKETLELEKELIKGKDVQSEIRNLKSEVKDTLHSEMVSYSENVKKTPSCTAAAPENLQKIMKKKTMIFGLNNVAISLYLLHLPTCFQVGGGSAA